MAALAGKTTGTTLTNVTVSSAEVTSTQSWYAYVGGLTGEGYTGTIENCTVDGLTLDAKGSFIGGISGQGYAKINNCTVKDSSIATMDWKVGGIVGQLNEGTFTFTGNQVLDSTITSTSNSGSVGGIIGFSNYGTKTLTGNVVHGVTLNSRTGAGGLIGSISSQPENSFTFSGCTVEDLTFQSDGAITSSGGLVGEEYWRASSGTTVSATGCTVTDVKVDAPEGSQVGALFGEFASGGNTYSVEDVKVTSTSGNAVSQLVGDPALGTSTFTMSGKDTVVGPAYVDEAVGYLSREGVVFKEDAGTGNFVVTDATNQVAYIKGAATYYTSLSTALRAAKAGDTVVLIADNGNGTAVTVICYDFGARQLSAARYHCGG